MTSSYDKSAAFVVLPAIGGGWLTDRSLRRWLGQSDLVEAAPPHELLGCLLSTLGKPGPGHGLAATRMWGQTGDRPAAWMAAADPVYLEPRRDNLCLHALSPAQLAGGELQGMFDHLQTLLGNDASCGFATVGTCGYVTSAEPFATATLPAIAIDGCSPNPYLPAGHSAAGHRRLVSEIEMALHEHPLNLAREAAGQAPANSLWLWGGGLAPEQVTEPLLPLFADDPLLLGHWLSRTAVAEHWPGTISDCLAASVAGFVAVLPTTVTNTESQTALHELRDALQTGRISALTLLFRDGIRANVRRLHSMRVWRRHSDMLDAGPDRSSLLAQRQAE